MCLTFFCHIQTLVSFKERYYFFPEINGTTDAGNGKWVRPHLPFFGNWRNMP